MTPDEEIRINNFKAQYNSILGIISIANHELEETYEKNKAAKATYEKLCKEIEAKVSELDVLIDKEEELATKAADRDRSLIRWESLLVQHERELKEQRDADLELIAKERAALDRDQVELKAKISKLVESRNAHEATVNELVNLVLIGRDDLASVEKAIAQARKEYGNILADLSHATNTYEKQKKLIDKEIRDAQKKRDDILKSVEKPQEFLAQREDALARKERDLKIIEKRFQEWHKSIFPDGKLNI